MTMTMTITMTMTMTMTMIATMMIGKPGLPAVHGLDSRRASGHRTLQRLQLLALHSAICAICATA